MTATYTDRYAALCAAWKADNVPAGTLDNGWTVEKFRIEDGGGFHAMIHGRGTANGDYTRLMTARGGLMMSDTDAERSDHLGFIRLAQHSGGHVLIGGLGLGCVLRCVLLDDQTAGGDRVEKVTVVEHEQAIIDWVAPTINDPRVEYVQGDVYEWKWPKGARFSAVWMDIWQQLSTDDLADMTRLRRRYSRVSDWNDCWGRTDLLRLRRQGW